MLEPVTIIIPTWNNAEYLFPCLQSITAHALFYPVNVIVVNNGHPSMSDLIHQKYPQVTVLTAGENLGWEGGLKYGLQHASTDFVMFANDDIFIPRSSSQWLRKMMAVFADPEVGAIGPASNCVMGAQNIWAPITEESLYSKFLIGFCILLRREALHRAGGVDDTLPGGDDLDLSIRIRAAGYKLVIDRQVFVYHHGFKTGERVHGNAAVAGGWNSEEMTDKTTIALIRKHGFKTWFDTLYIPAEQLKSVSSDSEGNLIRSLIPENTSVLELGCGATKTIPHAIGVDIVAKDQVIHTIGKLSTADVAADVEALPEGLGKFDFIVARHILEHCVNPLNTLRHWRSFLEPGGKLIVAVPWEGLVDSIPMNPEHKHAFTPEFLKDLLFVAGFWPKKSVDSKNAVSFIIEAEARNIEAVPEALTPDEGRDAGRELQDINA